MVELMAAMKPMNAASAMTATKEAMEAKEAAALTPKEMKSHGALRNNHPQV